MRCSLKHERALRKAGVEIIAGIDEAGRGPLAGPVVAAAVILPERFRHKKLTDSKKLSAEVREEIYGELTAEDSRIQWSVSVVGHEVVDRINILQATHQAMREAVGALPQVPQHALIDGRPVKPFPVPATALVKGDAASFSIAAASVIAKVTRDRIMLEMDVLYPEYHFARHKGYGTAEHLDKLRLYGPSPIHRCSFLPGEEKQLNLF